ncbi:MAG: hypothetical protein HUJ25_02630 [Crocinitomicaceae bacterium]|nr:hypothetical protein [Crocinitomicaceae bacterium]
MNRLIKNLGIGQEMSIKATIAVEELMNHDMIYIYHHLKNGSVVQLEQSGINLKGEPRYAVKFRGFLIGYATIAGIMRTFFEDQKEAEALVVSVSKQKFMPINGLDIQIGVQAMKKVG